MIVVSQMVAIFICWVGERSPSKTACNRPNLLMVTQVNDGLPPDLGQKRLNDLIRQLLFLVMTHSLWVEFYPGGFPLFRVLPGVLTYRKKCEADVFKRWKEIRYVKMSARALLPVWPVSEKHPDCPDAVHRQFGKSLPRRTVVDVRSISMQFHQKTDRSTAH